MKQTVSSENRHIAFTSRQAQFVYWISSYWSYTITF